nr:hypothetical protein [Mycoplasmopsis bovis]
MYLLTRTKINGNEKYGAYFAFDYIRYTPAIQSLYKYVLDNEFSEDKFPGYGNSFNEYQREYP